jgi:hypothetical protein
MPSQNIAILCSGRIKTTNVNIPIENFKKFKAAYPDANIVFFISLNPTAHNQEYTDKFCEELGISQAESVCVSAVTMTPHELEKLRPKHQGNCENMFSMFTHNKRAFDIMKQYEQRHAMQFDVVIKYRGDIVSSHPMQIPSPIKPNTLYVPNNNDFCGLNDQIALGDRATMDQYCRCNEYLIAVADTLCGYNPEALLLRYIKNHTQLKIYRYEFYYSLYR